MSNKYISITLMDKAGDILHRSKVESNELSAERILKNMDEIGYEDMLNVKPIIQLLDITTLKDRVANAPEHRMVIPLSHVSIVFQEGVLWPGEGGSIISNGYSFHPVKFMDVGKNKHGIDTVGLCLTDPTGTVYSTANYSVGDEPEAKAVKPEFLREGWTLGSFHRSGSCLTIIEVK